MLHLKFALNLENIVNEIIETISSYWKSPFDAPVVIFPDPKLEQWFKFRWIQKHKVLANLNKKTIDQFLFEILVGNDKTKKKLNADMLRNVMISYLTQKTDGVYNYKQLGTSVESYLENENGGLDENRLFDFTSTMAGLFLEYETSRPNGFFNDPETGTNAEGLLDCWNQNGLEDFFITQNGTVNEKEHWQRELYSNLFHEKAGKSLLTQVFEKLGEANGSTITYLTLPFLFKACKDGFNYPSDKPVFIIGLGGMGQFYRVVLHEFAKKHDIYAYIQNPCMEFWEDYTADTFRPRLPSITVDADDDSELIKDNENDLLRYWGKAGRDNIKLWSMACDYNTDFQNVQDESSKSIKPDTLLHQIQLAVAKRSNVLETVGTIQPDKDGNYFANDPSFHVSSAPSKIREVEAMHSHICKLLNGTATADGKPAKISDILVVSPNIDDYRTAIYQVFDQAKELSADTKTALHIPFSIVDSQASNSLVANALSTLFKLREKKELNRPDFFSLMRNPVVQHSRGIDPDEVSAWETWITEMNIFRDRNNDWIHGIKRLIAGRFSSKAICANNEFFAPYEDFESSDNRSLYRFIDCVESLEDWMSEKNWNDQIVESDLDRLTDFLDSWLLMQNPPTGLGGESIIYSNVSEAKKDLKYFFAAGSESITWKVISQMLMTAAQSSEYSCGNLFVNGLTFMKFTPNRTLPVKYLFILGIDANSFPGVSRTNTLDLRKSVRPWPGDDNPIAKNRYAFLCQLMSTGEGFFASYVNKNLQKDEDFYPSSVINDIRNFLKHSLPENISQDCILPVSKINLNEDRNWGDLFTQREIRNKTTLNFFHASQFNDRDYSKLKDNRNEYPIHVFCYQFKKFLEDPFQFSAEVNLNIDDNFQDQAKLEFEPIEAEFLTKYNLKKMAICVGLGIPENNEIQTSDDFDKYLDAHSDLPAEPYRQKEVAYIRGNVKEVISAIQDAYPSDRHTYSRKELSATLTNKVPDHNGNEKSLDWTISGTARVFIESVDGNEVHILDFCYKDPPKNTNYLSTYIAALTYISSLQQDNGPKVFIRIVSYTGSMTSPIEINQSPDSAASILQQIYHKAFVERFHKVLPINMFSSQLTYWKYIQTLKNFDGNFGEKSPWEYFSGKNLFDIEKVCGYDPDTFMKCWNADVHTQCDLMPDLKDILGLESSQEKQ